METCLLKQEPLEEVVRVPAHRQFLCLRCKLNGNRHKSIFLWRRRARSRRKSFSLKESLLLLKNKPPHTSSAINDREWRRRELKRRGWKHGELRHHHSPVILWLPVGPWFGVHQRGLCTSQASQSQCLYCLLVSFQTRLSNLSSNIIYSETSKS